LASGSLRSTVKGVMGYHRGDPNCEGAALYVCLTRFPYVASMAVKGYEWRRARHCVQRAEFGIGPMSDFLGTIGKTFGFLEESRGGGLYKEEGKPFGWK